MIRAVERAPRLESVKSQRLEIMTMVKGPGSGAFKS